MFSSRRLSLCLLVARRARFPLQRMQEVQRQSQSRSTSTQPRLLQHQLGAARVCCERRLSESEAAAAAAKAVVGYAEIERATRDPARLLVDVREPHELTELGHIPAAINIPLGSVAAALEMGAEEFERTYGRRKPSVDTELIFYCQVGKRSHRALLQALQLGYSSSKNYLGSYEEWSSKNK